MAEIVKLQRFVARIAALVEHGPGEPALLVGAQDAMTTLVASDDWLPDGFAKPHPHHYQQHLLHLDPNSRFSVVSFVWGPGQKTPIHDHTVWGVIGMLRGAEIAAPYERLGTRLVPGREIRLEPGQVELVAPSVGDIHQVSNAFADRVSISIHCYGGDIGQVRRHVYDRLTGATKEFVSGYATA